MSAGTVGLPLTGSGGTTADVAVDLIGGGAYQMMKLVDGTVGSTVVVTAAASAPSSNAGGMVTRPILQGSTAQVGYVGQGTAGSSAAPWWVYNVGASGAGSTVVDVASIAASTAHIGEVSISNPTTAVTITNPTTAVTITNPTTAVNVANQPTVDLSSQGSTRVIGRVEINTPTTAVNVANPTTSVTITNPTTAVTLTAGSSGNTVGSVALVAGSTANTVGAVAQGAGGTSAVYPWFVNSAIFSSDNTSRTSVSTTVDTQLVAASSRRAMIIANRSTSQIVACGFSTAAVTTARANVDFYIQPNSYVAFGISGGMPAYGGPIRGINISSTTVAGSVAVTQFF